MPVCYVVVAYHTQTQSWPASEELQVLCVFQDQVKARRYVENYPIGPDQRIVTLTSWLDDERYLPKTIRKTAKRADELRRLDGLPQRSQQYTTTSLT